MRALLGFAGSLAAVAALVVACADAPAPDGLCAQANAVFERCGATLPMLESGSCAGARKAVARCVVDHATTCDELGSLFARADQCVSDALDGGDDLAPPDDLAVPSSPRDAGRRDAEASDAGPTSSPPAPPPAPPPPSTPDAAADAPPTGFPGATFSGSVALAEERSFATATVAAGSYTVTMTGTNDADLYVKVGTAATTSVWDCRPFLAGTSDEDCTVTVTTPHAIHVLVRGEASSTSTFTVRVAAAP